MTVLSGSWVLPALGLSECDVRIFVSAALSASSRPTPSPVADDPHRTALRVGERSSGCGSRSRFLRCAPRLERFSADSISETGLPKRQSSDSATRASAAPLAGLANPQARAGPSRSSRQHGWQACRALAKHSVGLEPTSRSLPDAPRRAGHAGTLV
jgi:hypothetical protein